MAEEFLNRRWTQMDADDAKLPYPRSSAFIRGSNQWLMLAAIILLATGLRAWDLDRQSLWVDEGLTARLVEQPITRLIPEMRKIEQFPPLYHLLMHGWVRLPGVGGTRSEAMLRLPSAIFGIAAVVAAFFLARRMFDSPMAGLIAAMLLAVNPEQIEQSSNARGYTLFVLLALLACDRFLALVNRADNEKPARALNVGLLSVLTALMIYTHLYGATVIAAQGLVVLWIVVKRPMHRWRTIFSDWVIAIAIALALFLPWAFVLMNKQPGDTGYRPNWIPPADLAMLRELLITYAGSIMLAILLVPLAIAGTLVNPKFKSVALPLALLLTGIGLPIAFSAVAKPVFIPRYAFVPLIFGLLLAGAAIAFLMSRPHILAKSLAALLLGMILVLSTAPISVLPSFARREPRVNPDWRALVSELRWRAQPGDEIILSRWFATFVFAHYRDRGPGSERDSALKALSGRGFDLLPREQLRTLVGKDVWWIIETNSPSVPNDVFEVPPTHERRLRQTYRGLELWRLEPKQPRN